MGMGWFLVVIVGCLVWVYVNVAMNRRNFNEFDRRARKAVKFRSRLLHPPIQGLNAPRRKAAVAGCTGTATKS
jgi:hypothetical protein